MAKVNSTVVLRDPETFEPVVLRAGDTVPEWAEVGDHLTSAPEPVESVEEPTAEVEDQDEPGDTPGESWTNAEIKQYADDNGIDLGGATTKADMLAVIGG